MLKATVNHATDTKVKRTLSPAAGRIAKNLSFFTISYFLRQAVLTKEIQWLVPGVIHAALKVVLF
jgi:hypothetical protein